MELIFTLLYISTIISNENVTQQYGPFHKERRFPYFSEKHPIVEYCYSNKVPS